MKIKQDLETGQIQYILDAEEVYEIEEHIQALSEFVSIQAVETFRHTKEYRRLVGRIDELERLITTLQAKP